MPDAEKTVTTKTVTKKTVIPPSTSKRTRSTPKQKIIGPAQAVPGPSPLDSVYTEVANALKSTAELQHISAQALVQASENLKFSEEEKKITREYAQQAVTDHRAVATEIKNSVADAVRLSSESSAKSDTASQNITQKIEELSKKLDEKQQQVSSEIKASVADACLVKRQERHMTWRKLSPKKLRICQKKLIVQKIKLLLK
jgi:hypothetical protein